VFNGKHIISLICGIARHVVKWLSLREKYFKHFTLLKL
jgi:hypothetical protein